MSTLKKNPDGYWERDGQLFAYIAKIKTDKCLKSADIRKNFHPNSFVEYSLDKIYKDELNDDIIYLASVTKFEDSDKQAYPIPLCMLDLSDKQKRAIMRATKFPKKAFEKASVIKNEIDIDAFVPVELFDE